MRTRGVGLALELTFAAMLWILPGMVPAQHMLRGFFDIAALPRISHQDRNLRPASKSNNGDSSISTKHTKGSKSSKSSSKLSSKANKQRKKQVKPAPPDDGGDIIADDPCPAGDKDCVVLFSEDYEHPEYAFSDPKLNADPEDSKARCIAPEGDPNALLHWYSDNTKTINMAYGKKGNEYTQAETVEVVYLKTWKDSNTNEGLNLSDERGGKYAIGMLSTMQDDKLSLSFDTKGRRFVGFGMDIAAAAYEMCDVVPGQAFPTDPSEFEVSAIDKSSNNVLDTVTVTSKSGAPDGITILWTRVCGSLDVSQAKSGNIIFQWDALAPYYSFFDNLDIIASNDPKTLPPACPVV